MSLNMKQDKNYIITEVNPEGNIAHKDLFLTKGIRSTAAAKPLDNYIAHYSATVVNNLEEAGYTTKAKLNNDAWAHGGSGENSDFGPTQNPWNIDYVPGGSSSGSAAAVADGYVALATGTDTGGSIRQPASFCGVTGLKPTYGALSRYGIVAMASSLDSPGFFAKSVKEVSELYAVAAKSDVYDATSQSKIRDERFESFSQKNTDSMTIGIPAEYFDEAVDPEILEAVNKAVETLAQAGHKAVPVNMPHTKYGVFTYYVIMTTEVASNLGRYDGVRYGNDRTTFGAEAKRRIMLGTYASSAGYADKYYEKAAKVRTLIKQDFDKAFELVDCLLAPVSPIKQFKIGEKVDDPLAMYLADILTVNINLAGVPSLAVPCGFGSEGMPIGMQLIGPRWSESMLFALGEQYQGLTNWHTMKPEK